MNNGKPKRNRWNPYPWDKWFASSSFTLRRGKDFECPSYVMAAQIRNIASKGKFKRLGKLSLRILDDKVAVTITKHRRRSNTAAKSTKRAKG